jgi:hypothetical protein
MITRILVQASFVREYHLTGYGWTRKNNGQRVIDILPPLELGNKINGSKVSFTKFYKKVNFSSNFPFSNETKENP